MSSPDDICRALSERMPQIMHENFPNAKKSGASWRMGDLDGNQGSSCGVFRGTGGIYFAKDAATDESLSILGLLQRKRGGSWSETLAWAKKVCGIADVKEVVKKSKPRNVPLKGHSLRGTEPYNYLKDGAYRNKRCLSINFVELSSKTCHHPGRIVGTKSICALFTRIPWAIS